MNIDLSPHIQTRLIEEAQRRGLSIQAFLERLINECTVGAMDGQRETRELPVWRLGSMGPFHRRDIYDANSCV
jgi:hypothetical protein